MFEPVDLIKPFVFQLKTKVHLGPGSRFEIADYINDANYKKVGIVIDQNMAPLEIFKDLINSIRKIVEVKVVQCETGEPCYAYLDKVRHELDDKDLDAVVGIGGGSAIDVAKALAVLVHNRKESIEYRGFDKMSEPVLPIIAIPTTAGTGSEITPNASFVDTKTKKKMGINGEAVRPSLTAVDPELTMSCPKMPTISAALDSVVHGTEAFVAKKSNMMSRICAREGTLAVLSNIQEVVDNPGNIHARTAVMYGAFLSAIALMHSGTGPAAAMSYPLGVHYGVPHGIAGALFLPHVIEFNIKSGFYDYAGLKDNSDGVISTMVSKTSSKEGAELYLNKINETWQNLGIQKNLHDYDLDTILFINDTMELKGALDQNPVPFGRSELEAMVQKLYQKQ